MVGRAGLERGHPVQRSIRLHFIQPGKPTQNAFVESFNGKFREYCLNLHWFRSLDEARERINEWRRHYNEERPHSSLGRLSPKQFAERAACCRASSMSIEFNFPSHRWCSSGVRSTSISILRHFSFAHHHG